MLLVTRFIKGLRDELRAVVHVAPLLQPPAWAALLVLALLPVAAHLALDGGLLFWVQAVCLLGIGLLGLFSEFVAYYWRRRHWTRFPDGEEVVPFLPALLTLLSFPLYFFASVSLFAAAGQAWPHLIPVPDSGAAWGAALDNLLRSQIFFSLFEVFKLRLGPEFEGLHAENLVFATRFFLSAALIKFIIVLARAAYYRSRDMGRGTDLMARLEKAVVADDPALTAQVAGRLGDSLRDACDRLQAQTHQGQAQYAWQALAAMQAFALPHFERCVKAATGNTWHAQNAFLQQFRQHIHITEIPAQPASRRRSLLATPVLLLAGLSAVQFVLPGLAGTALSAVLLLLLAWLVLDTRRWAEALEQRGLIRAATPEQLAAWMQRGIWFAAPLLIATQTRLLFGLHEAGVPLFAPAPVTVDAVAVLFFTFDNLLRTQMLVDIFQVYGFYTADLRHEGLFGGLTTWANRLLLDATVIMAVKLWFDKRWFKLRRRWKKPEQKPEKTAKPKLDNAELRLHEEAERCGIHSPMLIRRYYEALHERLLALIEACRGRQKLLVALADSGFYGYAQQQPQAETPRESTPQDRLSAVKDGVACAEQHNNLGVALQEKQRNDEAIEEFRRAAAVYQQVMKAYGVDLRNDFAAATMNLANALGDAGRQADAIAAYRRVIKIRAHLVKAGKSELREELAMALGNLGTTLSDSGNKRAAEHMLRQAAILYLRLAKEGAAVTDKLASVLLNLGNEQGDSGRHAAAIQTYRKALPLYRKHIAAGAVALRDEEASLYMNLAVILESRGQLPSALQCYAKAIVLLTTLVREGRSELQTTLAKALGNRGNALWNNGQFPEAENSYRKAAKLYAARIRAGHTESRDDLARVRSNLGNVLRART